MKKRRAGHGADMSVTKESSKEQRKPGSICTEAAVEKNKGPRWAN